MVKPLLVMAHGTRTTKEEWDGYDALLPEAQVLPVDLPGHGARLGTRCTEASVLATFDEAVGSARPGQPVVLLGHSLGGYLAAWYAAELTAQGRDGVLAGLVLVGTTADPASRMAWIYKVFAQLLPRIGHERMTLVANALYRAMGERGELPGPEAYEALGDSWRIVFEHCGPENLRAVRCPVVFVNGQYDQMRLHVRRFAAMTPDTRQYVVRGATHLLPVTHPAALAGIVARVLEALPDEGAPASGPRTTAPGEREAD